MDFAQSDPNTLIYGVHPVLELVRTMPHAVEHVLLAREPAAPEIRELLGICRKERIPVHRLPPGKLAALVRNPKNQGVAAVRSVRPYNTVEELEVALQSRSSPPVLLVPASIEDPRNLGALVRTAAAFDVAGFLLEHKHTSPLNALVAKASAGLLERMLMVKPRNLEATVAGYRESGYSVIGADAAGTKPLHQVDLTRPTIIVLGGESRGIPPYLKKQCTQLIRIPTAPLVSSLNVGVAGAIILYETARQRGFSKPPLDEKGES